MRPGSGLCLSCVSAHDLTEEAGPTALALGALPQRPHPAGGGQPGGSVLHVEEAAAAAASSMPHDTAEPFSKPALLPLIFLTLYDFFFLFYRVYYR